MSDQANDKHLNLLDWRSFNEMVAGYLTQTGLARPQVAASMIGLPPMPVPPSCVDQHAPRFPRGVTPAVAGHPIYWLDQQVTRPMPHENETLWLARMWLELENAGWVHPDTGEVTNVLTQAGLDLDALETIERVTRLSEGIPDSDLDNLIVAPGEPPEGLDNNWAVHAAMELVTDLTQRWDTWVMGAQEDLTNIIDGVVERVEHPDFSVISKPFIEAGEEFRVAAEAGPVPDAVIARFGEGVEYLLEGLRLAHQDIQIIEELLGAGPTDDVNDEVVAAAHEQRAMRVRALADACFETGSIEANLREIIRFAAQEHQHLRSVGLHRLQALAAADVT